ncbi:MAG: 4Fe-4S dicluster domain-containing protein, partial [Candidatus Marinimicrobia bacterium]|nr:4Fe-4S dicluster domain-containing protein [Candidatus Neomarinimicrobiota bacterium]
EDVVFPVEVLGKALKNIQDMLKAYAYLDSVIWGHVMDGNFHFVIMQDFSKAEEIKKYHRFMNELTDLVLAHDGSLKGEHGTGRNMAPYVEKEWGSDIYALMKEVKKCLDPYNIFNPGVLINDDPEIHLKNLKTIPAVNPLIDKCIECGFCEKSCPSKDLTLTPRQRITVYRILESSEVPNPELARLFEYSGEATCATDGLCALACPVEINTGILIKELRFKNKTPGAEKIAEYLSTNMDKVTSWGRFVLNVVHFKHKLLGTGVLGFFANKAFKWSGKRIPLWNPQMPKGADLPPVLVEDSNENKNTVVYFPTCINRTMGNSADNADKKSLMQASVD